MIFKGLCLSGGGIAGFVHLGILHYLEEKRLTKNIDVIVCTSIGAVIGALVSVGVKSKDIHDRMVNINHDILQYSKLDEFFTCFGMESGEYFIAQLADIFMEHKVSPLVTFGEVWENYGKMLVITGTNVSKHQTTYFSKNDHFSMRILDAVRISIGIPFLFTATLYSNDLYVDGGITDNYPLQHCISLVQSMHPFLSNPQNYVIGSYIESMSIRNVNNIEDFIYGIFACCLKKYNNVDQVTSCTIFTPVDDVSSIEFSADKIKRENMFKHGYNACKVHINKIWYNDPQALIRTVSHQRLNHVRSFSSHLEKRYRSLSI